MNLQIQQPILPPIPQPPVNLHFTLSPYTTSIDSLSDSDSLPDSLPDLIEETIPSLPSSPTPQLYTPWHFTHLETYLNQRQREQLSLPTFKFHT